MENDVFTLEPDREAQERWLAAAARFALDALARLDGEPAAGTVGAEGARTADAVSTPIPERPLEGGIESALEILGRALPASQMTPGPGYLAYIPGGGLYASALADLVADCVNRYTGLTAASPALCRLEEDVLAWLARAFGYGAGARGLFTTGGSMATFGAVVTARREHLGAESDLRAAVAYTSCQAHHSVGKAVRLAGVPEANVRAIDVDGRLRMSPAALAGAVAADRRQGRRPFLVVATAGTTNTGAVDPMGPLADFCAAERLWLHVDGAYGGAFVLCEEGRRRLAGIERADSITFDPHKGLFLPYGTGCLLVRDGRKLRRAHQSDADYLQDMEGSAPEDVAWNPADYGPELSRDYRGLRLWLPLMLHGAGAFRRALDEKLALARRFHAGLVELISRGVAVDVVDEPQLSLVAFRAGRRAGEALEAWNRRNAAVLAAVNARGRVYLSSTLLPVAEGPAFTLRVCILSFRTHASRVDACLEDLEAALRAQA